MTRELTPLMFLALVAAACAAQRPRVSVPVSWVDAHGGAVVGEVHDRAARAARPIWPAAETRASAPFQVQVLGSRRVGAWAWPNGAIFLTAGLIEALQDDELAAAVCHEVGHLVAEGHLPTPASLDGADQRDGEERADQLGVKLLGAAGLPADAMSRMLAVVLGRLDRASPSRENLARRIALIER